MKPPVSAPHLQLTEFPEREIRASITRFWSEKKEEAENNPFAPPRQDTLHDVLPEIDSLEIVRFILRVEEIIDREVPSKFIMKGGYDNCDEMIRHLLPQLKELCALGSR
jgi:hypothetical protein